MYKRVGIAVGVLIVLGVAYYGISPIFRHVRVNDAAPQTINSPDSNAAVHTPADNTVATVVPTTAHPASGTVRVIKTKDGEVIRYENFKTLNGPDLYVYLANDLDAKDYVNLGTLKATEGNVNYDVPKDIDTTKYKYVLTWCKTFSVLFNYADISTPAR